MNTDAIGAYQSKAANQSTYNASRLATWGAATTKGPIAINNVPNMPSRDHLIIGGILVGGVLWYVYRRSKVVKNIEAAV